MKIINERYKQYEYTEELRSELDNKYEYNEKLRSEKYPQYEDTI